MALPPPVAGLAWYPELQLTVTVAPLTKVIKSGKTVPVPKTMGGFWQCCVDVLGGGGGELSGVGAAVEMHAAVAGCQYVPIHWAVAKDGLLIRKP